jgi:hypothetical protein
MLNKGVPTKDVNGTIVGTQYTTQNVTVTDVNGTDITTTKQVAGYITGYPKYVGGSYM